MSHIHPDHAGGAGQLIQELPNARVVVAARGVEIMAQPERLMASVRRTLGSLTDLYGEMIPIDIERLLAAEEAEKAETS